MQASSYDMENREIIKVLLSTGYLTVGYQGVTKIKNILLLVKVIDTTVIVTFQTKLQLEYLICNIFIIM